MSRSYVVFGKVVKGSTDLDDYDYGDEDEPEEDADLDPEEDV